MLMTKTWDHLNGRKITKHLIRLVSCEFIYDMPLKWIAA